MTRMKLATLRHGGRDGTLVVVDNALETCIRPRGIATTLSFSSSRVAAPPGTSLTGSRPPSPKTDHPLLLLTA